MSTVFQITCCDMFGVYVYIYICVYLHKRAGASDILTSIYTTGLLFFELTFAGTV